MLLAPALEAIRVKFNFIYIRFLSLTAWQRRMQKMSEDLKLDIPFSKDIIRNLQTMTCKQALVTEAISLQEVACTHHAYAQWLLNPN